MSDKYSAKRRLSLTKLNAVSLATGLLERIQAGQFDEVTLDAASEAIEILKDIARDAQDVIELMEHNKVLCEILASPQLPAERPDFSILAEGNLR